MQQMELQQKQGGGDSTVSKKVSAKSAKAHQKAQEASDKKKVK